MRSFIIQWFGIPDDPININNERLVRRENFIFANVPELGRTIPIGGLDPDNFMINSTLVHLTYIARFGKRWGILIYVRNGNVDSGAAK